MAKPVLFDLDIQCALVAALLADPTIAGIVGTNVFDDVPQGTAFPYIVVGDSPWTDGGTDDDFGQDYTININTYSRYSGRKETKEILAAIYTLLHLEELVLNLSTGYSANLRASSGSTFKESDGETYRGVITLSSTMFTKR